MLGADLIPGRGSALELLGLLGRDRRGCGPAGIGPHGERFGVRRPAPGSLIGFEGDQDLTGRFGVAGGRRLERTALAVRTVVAQSLGSGLLCGLPEDQPLGHLELLIGERA